MSQNMIQYTTLKLSQKTSVLNVNVSMIIVVCLTPESCKSVKIQHNISLWKGTTHFGYLETSCLLLLCVIVYKVIQWSHCELRRDLLYFLNTCSDIDRNI